MKSATRATRSSNAPKAKSGRAEQTGSQTVDRALQILECFTPNQRSLSLTELSEKTGLTVPTTHRLLKALQRRHFVVLENGTRRYTLGAGAMRLAGIMLDRDDLHAIVPPHLERLREVTQETAALHWLIDEQRVCVMEFVSRQAIRMSSGVGQQYPLVAGASGKAILAFLEPDRIAEVIARANARGELPRARSEAELLRDLAHVRELGFATSLGEVVEGAAALAVPIRDAQGRPIAAINITGPSNRWTEARMRDSVGLLRESAREIEARMGFEAAGR